jgi:hypothetical protein
MPARPETLVFTVSFQVDTKVQVGASRERKVGKRLKADRILLINRTTYFSYPNTTNNVLILLLL